MMIMRMIKKRHLYLKQEGDDVYFECLIVSNPAATRLEWYHRVSSIFNIQIIIMAKTILVMTINAIKNFMIKASLSL